MCCPSIKIVVFGGLGRFGASVLSGSGEETTRERKRRGRKSVKINRLDQPKKKKKSKKQLQNESPPSDFKIRARGIEKFIM